MTETFKRAAHAVFRNGLSHPQGDQYKNIGLYDFRHSGTINLRILAKENPSLISLDAIRHRAGWADFSMLNYYTQFIGIDGKIEKQGMLVKKDKHVLEQRVEELEELIRNLGLENAKVLKAVSMLAPVGTGSPHANRRS